MNKNICYVCDDELIKHCNKIPVLKNRASMVQELIKSYGLLNFMQVKRSSRANYEELRLFHSSFYLGYLMKNQKGHEGPSESDSDSEDPDEDTEGCGLVYDCPKFSNLYDFVRVIAGGTLAAVECIFSGSKVAINWTGGWHHAQKDEAEGFCYVNDIVIGIQKLREKFKKILYIDLDIHHGNGVENAFAYSKNILTVSFHQHELGFYPGSGEISHIGVGTGRGFAINAPYKRSISGDLFRKYFKTVAEEAFNRFKPDVCVIQCGGDAIVGDPLGGTNLNLVDLGSCIQCILEWNIPGIFLGGGGYDFANTARYWTYLTSIICGTQLAEDIPENEYFEKYGPDFTMNITKSYAQDQNVESEIEEHIKIIVGNMREFIS